jgi:hypothetical protein
MKRFSIVVMAAVILAGGLGCESQKSGGGGGGLFGGGGTASSMMVSWDIMMMLQPPLPPPGCVLGFPDRGAPVNPAFPGGYFPGVHISTSSMQYSADIPEVKMLAYVMVAPLVAKGDKIHLSFFYRADTDDKNGDYFLARVIDGDRFLVPVDIHGEKMTDGTWKEVSLDYEASTAGFSLEFIVGLSSAADFLYLDDLEVTVNNLPMVIENFDAGNYTVPAPGPVTRYPFLPAQMQGSLAVDNGVVHSGAGSLRFGGGSYFVLYGQGGSAGGSSSIVLTYTEPNALTPFYGQTQAIKQNGTYVGNYLGFDSSVTPACSEAGSAIISIAPEGNADLAGNWTIQLLAACQQPGLGFAGPGGVPVYFGTTTVAPQAMAFAGAPFVSAFGDAVDTFQGQSMGEAGFFLLGSSAVGTGAVLVGTYDESTGVFSGQVTGTLPEIGQVCTVTAGQFIAFIVKP